MPTLLREARDGRHSRPSWGHAHPQALSKASMLLDKRGRQAYLLVTELFLSWRASSRCCSSTMTLDRSSGVLGEQKHRGQWGCACRRRALTLAAAQSQARRWRTPEQGESGPVRPRTAGLGLTAPLAAGQVTLGTSLVPALACKNRVGASHHGHAEAVNEEECLPAAAEGVPRARWLPLLLAGPTRADGSSGTTGAAGTAPPV